MFVKPAEGRVVRRPDTLVHLAAEGEHVPDGDEFWTRRLRDEDVVEAKPPPEKEEAADRAKDQSDHKLDDLGPVSSLEGVHHFPDGEGVEFTGTAKPDALPPLSPAEERPA